MDKIKSTLIYFLGGLGSLILVLQLFVWISPISRAQENSPSQDPNLKLPPTTPTKDLPVPTTPSKEEVPSAVPPTATTSTTPPADGQPVLPQLTDSPSQAGDFLAPYIFDTREGRRNPFRPMVLKDDDGDRAAIGPATPLERYDISELKLIAIMWDVKNPRAMIMDPNKEIQVIGKDDRIGRRQGYVATIREGELVVVETTEFNGEMVYATRVMRIEK